MSDSTEEIGFRLALDEGNSQKTVKTFKQELKEAQKHVIDISRQFGELSPQAIQAAKALGKLKEEMNDVKELTAAVTEEKRFHAFAGFAGSLAGGFSAATGAIGLASGESEKFEEIMIRVQSAMALSQGLAQISEIGRMWGVAKSALSSFTIVQKINEAATASAAVVQKFFTGSVDTTSTSFKNLRGAIIATGIGALVVGIGLLIANFDKIKVALSSTTEEQKLLNETLDDYKKAATSATQKVAEVNSAFDLAKKGVISKKEALQKYNDTLGDSLGKTNSLTQAEKNLADKAEDYIKVTGLKAQANALFAKSAEKTAEALIAQSEGAEIRKGKNNLSDLQKNFFAEFDAKIADKIKEGDSINKLAEGLLEKAAGFAKRSKLSGSVVNDKAEVESVKKKNKDISAENKAAREKQEKEETERFNEIQKKYEEDTQKAIESLRSKHAYELALLKASGKNTVEERNRQIDEEIQQLKEGGGKFLDGIVALEREKVLVAADAKQKALEEQKKKDEERAAAEKEISEELKQEAIDQRAENEANELLAVKEKYDLWRSIVKDNEQMITAITDAESKAQAAVRKKWDDITLQQKQENAGKLASVLGNLSAAVGKETAVGKGLAVAEATISTYLGAAKALSGISSKNPFGAALAIAQASAVVLSGMKSVKEILKVKIPNAGGAGEGSAPAGANVSSASSSPVTSDNPTMNGIQTTLLDQTKEIAEGKDSLKAYVVESEITQSQERQKAITQTANF